MDFTTPDTAAGGFQVDEPLVTIMIPTYNGARWIGETVGAAMAQTHRNLRILVSDDRSTDGTPELVAKFAESDPRVQLISTGGRSRWIGNTNHLLDQVEGDYACFLMHDDLIVDDYVATLLHALKSQPRHAVAYGDMVLFSEQGLRPPLQSRLMHRARGRIGRCLAVAVESNWSVALRGLAPVALLKTAPRPRVHDAGEYGADGPWIAALALFASFVRVPEVLYYKRTHDTGVTSDWHRSVDTAAALTRSYFEITREVPLRRWERATLETAFRARLALVKAGASKQRFTPVRIDDQHENARPVLRRSR